MKNKFQQNFNTFSNLFILFILFFGGLIYADTNGVWQYASDTRGGTFGGDEQLATSNFTFINPVYFGQPLKSLSNSSTYFINIAGRTQLNDTALNKLSITNTNGNAIITTSTTGDGIQASTTATGKSAISAYTTNPNSYSGFFDGNVVINSGNLSVKTVANCNGKLITDVNGNLICDNTPAVSIPSGAIMSFNLTNCPTGWSSFSSADGRTIIGTSANFSFGAIGGEINHTLTIAEIPAHTHSYVKTTGFQTGVQWTWNPQNYMQHATLSLTINTSSTGGNQSHNIMQPYIALTYCVKN